MPFTASAASAASALSIFETAVFAAVPAAALQEETALRAQWGRWLSTPVDDPQSGTFEFTLFQKLPTGTKANPGLSVTVTGRPFHGLLKNLDGAKVTPSPVLYNSNGTPQPNVAGQQAFIVDLGVSLSILGLEITQDKAGPAPAIVLVLPWLGTDFNPRAFFPPSSAQPPVPIPALPATASSTVSLTGGETTRLLIQLSGPPMIAAADFGSRCRITTGTYPTNVKASLDGRLPFWTKPGPLRGGGEPATGLVADLNALLGTLTTPADIKLTLTSDLPGVLSIQATAPPEGSIVHTATARWGGQDSTQVALAALEPAVLSVPFPSPSATPWQIAGLSLKLSGTFPPWRAYPGQTTSYPGDLGMKVDAHFGVARRIEFAQAGQLFGAALAMRAPASDAQIHLEVQAEQSGLPGGGKPLAAKDVTLAAPIGAGPASSGPGGSGAAGAGPGAGPVHWYEVTLASPVTVKAGAGVWVVAKAKIGSAEWVGAPEAAAPLTRTVFAADGGPWEDYPTIDQSAPVAQIRVLRRPFPEENTPLLDVAWSSPQPAAGSPATGDAGAATTTLDLGPPAPAAPPLTPSGGTVSVALSVMARASGTLTLKAAAVTYTQMTDAKVGDAAASG